MDDLFHSYSTKAKNELRKIADSVPKKYLQHLTDLTYIQV
jgi:octaprenyl-diphosphate synthase